MRQSYSEQEIIVIAIGGNSLVKNGRQSASLAEQKQTIQETTENIAKIVKLGYKVLITHGNGPQVGDILIRSFLTRKHLAEIPLDVANAITQSEIGYLIQQSLKNEFLKRKLNKDVVTIITQVIVDKNDPAFNQFTKPVGPFYSKKEAITLQQERKWIMQEDAGRGYRRMVSSPKPKSIVEINEIIYLLSNDIIVIAGGGGGIAVYEDKNKLLKPLPAVIDKDLTSALIGTLINAKTLIISTSIDRVYLNFNKPNQKPLLKVTKNQALKYLDEGHFQEGSMKPKIVAGIN
ncbi:MAG: carbamate kinase, partial [candidate division WOR-3 bacterium]|nr:carbamate kinase [candidate division WOR-3 bacterium]